tara:strand:+ start:714 stop:2096 length:1383 start_codon:yes stop_codon:yes gene_type:complete
MKFFKSNFIRNLFFAVITALFIDFVAFDRIFSTVIHLVLFCYIGFLIIKNHKKALLVVIGYGILIPTYPRTILDDVDLLMAGDVEYTTFYSLGAGPLNLYFILLVLLLFKLTYLNKGNIASLRKQNIYLFLFIITILTSFSYNFFFQTAYVNFSVNYFSVIKFLLYSFLGFFIFKTFKGSVNINFFFNIAIILGMRVGFFLIFDALFANIPKLDFALQPYITMPLLFVVLGNKIKLNALDFIFIVFSLLYPSRSFILLFLISALIFGFSTKFSRPFVKLVGSLSVVIVLVGVILYTYNERIFDFFLWKLEVINTVSGNSEMSGSGDIRLLELKNIFAKISSSPLSLLLGEGPFGYYNFDYFPLQIKGTIDSKSFPYDQVLSDKYFTVHNFTSFLLLKLGFIGLFLYFLFASTILFIKNKSSKIHTQLSFLPLLYTYYFNPINALFLGILMSNKVSYETNK